MPLVAGSILFCYTHTCSGPANNTLCLGTSLSGYTITSGTINNIFDDVTGDESTNGATIYRAIAFKDTDAVYDMIDPQIWISGFDAGSPADTISIAKSTFAINGNTMGSLTSETYSPTETVSWVTEGAPSTTINWSAATLTHGNWLGVWLRRIVPAGAGAKNQRAVTINVRCETTASPYRSYVLNTYVLNWDM